MDPRRARKLVGERSGEILRAEDVLHSFQVADHGRQADFCLCATLPLRKPRFQFGTAPPKPHVPSEPNAGDAILLRRSAPRLVANPD